MGLCKKCAKELPENGEDFCSEVCCEEHSDAMNLKQADKCSELETDDETEEEELEG